MADITERDNDIFRILSSGPTTILQIRERLNTIYKKEISLSALYVRLSKLMKDSLIVSQHYPNRNGKGRFTLYCLTDEGADLLVPMGYRKHTIRRHLPGVFFVAHDLEVTDVVRAVKKGAEKSMISSYTILDEYYLKSVSMKDKDKRLKSYPDLLVDMTIGGKYHIYALEIDNGTIAPREMAEKLMHMNWITINICTVQKRITMVKSALLELIRAAAETNKKGQSKEDLEKIQSLPNRILFCLLSDFVDKTLLGNKFVTLGSGKAEIVRDGIMPCSN